MSRSSHRAARWLAAALLAVACSGEEPPAPPPAEAESAEAAPPTGADWWSSARSIDSKPEAADGADPKAVVSCRLESGKRFMRRGECLVQGGRVEG